MGALWLSTRQEHRRACGSEAAAIGGEAVAIGPSAKRVAILGKVFIFA
ncbi:MAG: hypothetical protein IJ714_06840 [Bacteroidales bacterium]|nr:hypothetical protein [Bacteroidales bacterium]